MKIEIRPYEDSHIPQTIEWLRSSDIRELFGITYDVSEEAHKIWVTANPNVEMLALYCDANHVGNIVLSHNNRHFSTNLQIYLGTAEMRGKGLGKIFMRLALDYVFTKRNQNRVWLHVREYNEAARRLYLGLGFRREGLERQSIWTGKKFINQELMSILKQDWRASL